MPVFLDDQQQIEVDDLDLEALAHHVLREQRVPDDMEVSLLLVDEPAMADLNRVHMGVEGPTDVLAFPVDAPGTTLPGEPALLGDVVVCPQVARRQAQEHGRDAVDEVRMLVVHGLLHLLGMDHADPRDEREMFALTDRLLAGHATRGGG